MKRIILFSGFKFQVSGFRGVFLLMLLCVSTLHAQDQSDISMYWAVPTQYNAAAAGSDSLMRITVTNRFSVSADMPVKIGGRMHGLGVSAVHQTIKMPQDSLAVSTLAQKDSTITRIGLQYAYRIKAGRQGSLSLGAQLGIDDTSAAIGLGAYYTKRFHRNDVYLGLSTHQFDTYYFLAGCNIPVSRTLYIVQPSMFVRSTPHRTQADATLRVTYDQRYWAGASYRYDDAVVLMLGANIQHLRIGYSYDLYSTRSDTGDKGRHEVYVSYFLKLDFGRQPHPSKSIRIL